MELGDVNPPVPSGLGGCSSHINSIGYVPTSTRNCTSQSQVLDKLCMNIVTSHTSTSVHLVSQLLPYGCQPRHTQCF
eukprot:2014807-Amphidinium_carterae.1